MGILDNNNVVWCQVGVLDNNNACTAKSHNFLEFPSLPSISAACVVSAAPRKRDLSQAATKDRTGLEPDGEIGQAGSCV